MQFLLDRTRFENTQRHGGGGGGGGGGGMGGMDMASIATTSFVPIAQALTNDRIIDQQESSLDDVRDLLINTGQSIAGMDPEFVLANLGLGDLVYAGLPGLAGGAGNPALAAYSTNAMATAGAPVTMANYMGGSPMSQAVNIAGTLGLTRRAFNRTIRDLGAGVDNHRTNRVAAAMGFNPQPGATPTQQLYAANEDFTRQSSEMLAGLQPTLQAMQGQQPANLQGIIDYNQNTLDLAGQSMDPLNALFQNSLAQMPGALENIGWSVPYAQQTAQGAGSAADQSMMFAGQAPMYGIPALEAGEGAMNAANMALLSSPAVYETAQAMGIPIGEAQNLMGQLSALGLQPSEIPGVMEGIFMEAAAEGPITLADIESREQQVIEALMGRLDYQTGEQEQAALERGNAMGINPAFALGELAQERVMRGMDIESFEALERTLGLLGGSEALRQSSLAGTLGAGTSALEAYLGQIGGMAGLTNETTANLGNLLMGQNQGYANAVNAYGNVGTAYANAAQPFLGYANLLNNSSNASANAANAYGVATDALGSAQTQGAQHYNALQNAANYGLGTEQQLLSQLLGFNALGQGDLANAAGLFNQGASISSGAATANAQQANQILAALEFFNANTQNAETMTNVGLDIQGLMMGLEGGLADIPGDFLNNISFAVNANNSVQYMNDLMGSMGGYSGNPDSMSTTFA